MPKRVNHDERRRQIAEAVWRLAATNGLEEVTLRRVAAEAGVSVRLVQYYFGTRHELLVKSLEILNADTDEHARELIHEAAPEPTPRGVLRAALVEMLPFDERRRTRYLVHLAYFVRILHDDELAATYRDAPPALEELFANLIDWGRDLGQVAAGLDPRMEAELLLTSVDGLRSALVLGNRSEEATLDLVDHLLDRVFVVLE